MQESIFVFWSIILSLHVWEMWNLLLETESSIGDELITNLRIFQRHTWFVEAEDINNTITRQGSIPRVNTAWKVSKYGVFSGPYFPTFGLNTEQKRLRVWTLFTQWKQQLHQSFQIKTQQKLKLNTIKTKIKIKVCIVDLD